MTKQEMLNKMLVHLAGMERRCSNGRGTCMYRAPRGGACLVGALIPEDLYTADMEEPQGGEDSSISNNPLVQAAIGGEEHVGFLVSAQRSHDLTTCLDVGPGFRTKVAEKLAAVARTHDLAFSPPASLAAEMANP